MKATAIIVCRYKSSRLRGKHFKKIGDKYLIEHTINFIQKNKFINEIYIASGKEKDNKIFREKLSSKFPKIKFYFHHNETNVVQRIYCVSKKIKNEIMITISGDCPIIDNNFLLKNFNLFKKKKFDYCLAQKKLQHEGILISNKNIWKTANVSCKEKKFQEHPSLFFLKNKKKFRVMNYKYGLLDLYKDLRMSVDTQSDLDYFNLIFFYIKKKRISFNFKNIVNLNKFSFINSHVNQKKVNFFEEKKIIIISTKNKVFGLGHYKRAAVIEREIIERMSIVPTHLVIKNIEHIPKIINQIKKKIINKKMIFIFDLPEKYFQFFKKLKFKNKRLLIDLWTNLKNDISIMPSIRKNIKTKYTGLNYLLLDRSLLKNYLLWKINKKSFIYDLAIISGGTFQLKSHFLKDLLKIKKKMKYIIILGPYASKTTEKKLNKLNINFIKNPKNYFEILLRSKNIISRFGNSVHEMIYFKKKPWILSHNETKNRNDDINYLCKLNLAEKYNVQNILNNTKIKHINSKKKMILGGKNLITLLKKIENE